MPYFNGETPPQGWHRCIVNGCDLVGTGLPQTLTYLYPEEEEEEQEGWGVVSWGHWFAESYAAGRK